MIESARLKTTSDILKLAKGRPADTVISDYFRHNRYIGSKDKKAILTRFYRILRNWFKYRWWMDKYNIQPSTFYLTLFDAAFNKEDHEELFKEGEYSFPELDKQQIKLFQKLSKENLIHKDMPEQIVLECPDEYWDLYNGSFSKEEVKNELEAMQNQAPFDLRANPLKITRDELLKEVPDSEPTPHSPFGLRLQKRINITELNAFRNGGIEVQDEGSQLISIIVDAKAGESIVDFCAGAGGKTLLMAGMMQNKGRIVACDIFEGKLKRAKQRFKRADIQNTSTKLLDSSADKWIKRNQAIFDKVLVDSPCSGSGTWRRNPDMKLKPIDMEKINQTQSDILKKASSLVKKGGYLYYATCSMFKQENENIVAKFLETDPTFTLEKINGEEFFKSSPYKTNTDGFFVAKLQKTPAKAVDLNKILSSEAGGDINSINEKSAPAKTKVNTEKEDTTVKGLTGGNANTMGADPSSETEIGTPATAEARAKKIKKKQPAMNT